MRMNVRSVDTTFGQDVDPKVLQLQWATIEIEGQLVKDEGGPDGLTIRVQSYRIVR